MCSFCGLGGVNIREHKTEWYEGWLYCDKCNDALQHSISQNYKKYKSLDIRKFNTIFPEIAQKAEYTVKRTSGELQHDWVLGNQFFEPIVHIVDDRRCQTYTYTDKSDIVVWFSRKSTTSKKAIRLSEFYEHNEDKLGITIDEFKDRVLEVIL